MPGLPFDRSHKSVRLLTVVKAAGIAARVLRYASKAMNAIDSVRVNTRNQKLHTRNYPSTGQPKAVLVWHHGYGEHILRYNHFLSNLASQGIAVYAQEAHGHGTSEPTDERNRCLVWNFQDLIDDASAFAYEAQAKYVSVPHFVGGQSLGGLITTLVALQDQSKWAGMILCSAAMNIEWTLSLRTADDHIVCYVQCSCITAILRGAEHVFVSDTGASSAVRWPCWLQAPMGGLLASLVPRSRIVPAVKPEDMSQDPAVVADYVSDKLNFVGPVRARTANEILKGFRLCDRRQAEIKLPVLAVHGTHDHCTSLPAVRRLIEAAQSQDKTLREIEGGYHELLLGPEKESVISLVQDWVLAHAVSSGASKM